MALCELVEFMSLVFLNALAASFGVVGALTWFGLNELMCLIVLAGVVCMFDLVGVVVWSPCSVRSNWLSCVGSMDLVGVVDVILLIDVIDRFACYGYG